MNLIHASCVSLSGHGILIRGISGSGKSSLCLQLIMDHAADLVSDDQVQITSQDGSIFASAPKPLQGLIEVRGLGLVQFPFLVEAKISLIIDLAVAISIERLPEPQDLHVMLLGVNLPSLQLDAKQTQATAIIRAAMQHFSLH